MTKPVSSSASAATSLRRRSALRPDRLAQEVQDDENSRKARHHQQQRRQEGQQPHHHDDSDGTAQVEAVAVADAQVHLRDVGSPAVAPRAAFCAAAAVIFCTSCVADCDGAVFEAAGATVCCAPAVRGAETRPLPQPSDLSLTEARWSEPI
jgi:hypothetical protein